MHLQPLNCFYLLLLCLKASRNIWSNFKVILQKLHLFHFQRLRQSAQTLLLLLLFSSFFFFFFFFLRKIVRIDLETGNRQLTHTCGLFLVLFSPPYPLKRSETFGSNQRIEISPTTSISSCLMYFSFCLSAYALLGLDPTKLRHFLKKKKKKQFLVNKYQNSRVNFCLAQGYLVYKLYNIHCTQKSIKYLKKKKNFDFNIICRISEINLG